MSFEIVVKLVDELMYMSNQGRLDDLEVAILRGSWHGQTYAEIANDFGCSEIHVRSEGSKLWQKLSSATGEEVSKNNFRATVDRMTINSYNSSSSDRPNASSSDRSNAIVISNSYHINLGSILPDPVTQNKESDQTFDSEPDVNDRRFITTMPEIEGTIARTSELETLSQWIVEDQCRAIGLWGLPNVGKSRLAAQLVGQLSDRFAAIIWRTLTPDTDPDQLIDDLNRCLARDAPPIEHRSSQPLNQLFDRLRVERCLVIIDGLEIGFVPGQWAGTWNHDGYSGLAQLVDRAARCRHHSCLLFTSTEIPINWTALETKYQRTRSLVVNGFDMADGMALLHTQALTPVEVLPELSAVFGGHPGWLLAAAQATHKWFDGDAAEFVQFGGLLPEGVLADLTHLGDRLTPSEKYALCLVALQSSALPVPTLRQVMNVSPTESFALIESLQRRSAIEKTKFGRSTVIALQPVIQAWAAETLARITIQGVK